jgi:hypothetical protein
MSFDSTFDYTPVVKGLTAERDRLASTVAALQKEKVLLEGATAYADSLAVGNRIIQLGIEIDRESKVLDAANDVLAEIAEVVALTEEKKSDLYYFYSIVETTKQDFMSKVLFNHHAALKRYSESRKYNYHDLKKAGTLENVILYPSYLYVYMERIKNLS